MDWIDGGRHGISGQLRLPASHWPLTRPTRPRTLVFQRFRRRRTSCPPRRRLVQQMRQMQRQRFALPANVGDRRDLPEHAAGQGAESEQALRNHTGPAAQRARRRHVETQPAFIGSHQSVAQQRAQQRIAALRDIGARPGAVHHARNAQRRRIAAAKAKPHIDRALDRIAAGDATGVDAQLSARASGVDTRRDGRRHAMPMHVPPRPQMAQEALSIGVRQRLPDLLREWPQAVDHAAPGIARLGHVLADDSRQLAQIGGQRRLDRRHRRSVRMPTRQQAAARYHMDRTGMSLIEQCDHRVDHRQAGADQQHGRAGVQRVKCSRRPRIGTPKWRCLQARGIGRGRSVVAGGEHDDIGSDRVARGKTQHAILDCHRAVVQRLQRARRRVQQMPQIGAIQPARHERRFGRPHAIQQLWRLTLPASRGSGAADRQTRSCARPARSAGGWDCRLHRRDQDRTAICARST